MTILKRSASMVSALVMMISSAGAYNCSAEGTTVNDSNTNNTREIVIDGTTAQLKENMRYRGAGMVVFHRLKVAKQQRPLLANKSDEELMNFICEALQKRHPFYSQAKFLFRADELEDKSQIQASVDSLRKLLDK